MSEKAVKLGENLGVFVFMGLFVMVGLITAGWFVQNGLMAFRSADRVVTVKGLAERDVEADLAIWTLNHSATGNNLNEVQQSIETNQKTILTYLDYLGFGGDEVGIAPLQVQDLLAQAYRPDNLEKGRYIITQQIVVRSGALDKVSKGLAELGTLLRQNVSLTNMQPPTYIFTDLNAIKPSMLEEAVKNARESAGQFAKDSGASVGGIKSAYQGVFQILPRDPVQYVSEQNQRYKTVRVVSTIDFVLE